MIEEFFAILILIVLATPPMVFGVRWLFRTFHKYFP